MSKKTPPNRIYFVLCNDDPVDQLTTQHLAPFAFTRLQDAEQHLQDEDGDCCGDGLMIVSYKRANIVKRTSGDDE